MSDNREISGQVSNIDVTPGMDTICIVTVAKADGEDSILLAFGVDAQITVDGKRVSSVGELISRVIARECTATIKSESNADFIITPPSPL